VTQELYEWGVLFQALSWTCYEFRNVPLHLFLFFKIHKRTLKPFRCPAKCWHIQLIQLKKHIIPLFFKLFCYIRRQNSIFFFGHFSEMANGGFAVVIRWNPAPAQVCWNRSCKGTHFHWQTDWRTTSLLNGISKSHSATKQGGRCSLPESINFG